MTKLRVLPKMYLTLFGCLVILNTASAQDVSANKWQYLGELYLMFPNMNGEVGIGNLPTVEVDASAADVLGHLEFGAMAYFEATNNNWSLGSDLIYMRLGQDISGGSIVTSGNLTMKQFAWEIAGLKRLTPWLEAGLAGRLVNLYAGFNLETMTSEPKKSSTTKTWFDPVIVLRSNNTIKEKWLAQLRVDAGGFSIGSDFTWQLQANVGYRFSDLFQTTIGYRYIGIDYDKGQGADRFLYDIDTFGWVVRLGFNF